MNDSKDFLSKCNKNPIYCGQFENKTHGCKEMDGYCPIRLIKLDGWYTSNALQPDEDKLAVMLCAAIPNNSGFGLYDVKNNENSITYIFGSVTSKKKIYITVE
jgi:hypothetical protein